LITICRNQQERFVNFSIGTQHVTALCLAVFFPKGGYAAKPTPEDGERLRMVARHHRACGILLAVWKKGDAARFFSLRKKRSITGSDWTEVLDLRSFFN
jgi:hypothetical protein